MSTRKKNREDDWMSGGNEFHSRDSATGNVRRPTVGMVAQAAGVMMTIEVGDGRASQRHEPTDSDMMARDRATPCSTSSSSFGVIVIPAKAREYVFTGVGLCVRVCVCDHDNKKCGWICTEFYAKIPRGKRKTKFVFRYDR